MTAWPALTLATLLLAGCGPAQSPDKAAGSAAGAPSTPLPTRQTTIDPVKSKLDAAQSDAERRRAEADQVGR
jgi:outer membrane murein-binding lipoprotein Lpp